ncbi:MAG TPA: hypothetical protein VMI54_17410 [Polyangiaceae bacterium]|nr:hypothetical protein [Polyangiaceae bacterium]
MTSATYTITGPNDFASAGTVPVGDSLDVPVPVSHVPVGQGYELDASANASDGVTVCMGSTTFDVTDPNATLMVTVHLDCAIPTGDVMVSATLNVCPVIDDLTAAPLIVNVGGVSSMSVVAHDADNGPSPLSYAWSVGGVPLPNRTQPHLSFACTAHGDVTVAASVSDGDPNPNCADTESVKVTCQ